MEIKLEEKDNEVSINLTGTLNIYYASELYNILKEKINNYEKLNIDLRGIDDIDFSIMQLLYSAKKTAEHEEKKIDIIMDKNKFINKFKILGINIDNFL